MTKDEIIQHLLDEGAIRVDLERGLVFSNRRRPRQPLGSIDKHGYLTSSVGYQGKLYSVLVHRIVAIAAYGVPGPGLHVAHLNHAKTDNRAVNLAFVSPRENVRQSMEAGRMFVQREAKLTADAACKIRRLTQGAKPPTGSWQFGLE